MSLADLVNGSYELERGEPRALKAPAPNIEGTSSADIDKSSQRFSLSP